MAFSDYWRKSLAGLLETSGSRPILQRLRPSWPPLGNVGSLLSSTGLLGLPNCYSQPRPLQGCIRLFGLLRDDIGLLGLFKVVGLLVPLRRKWPYWPLQSSSGHPWNYLSRILFLSSSSGHFWSHKSGIDLFGLFKRLLLFSALQTGVRILQGGIVLPWTTCLLLYALGDFQ